MRISRNEGKHPEEKWVFMKVNKEAQRLVCIKVRVIDTHPFRKIMRRNDFNILFNSHSMVGKERRWEDIIV
jgi:hypothetical protein